MAVKMVKPESSNPAVMTMDQYTQAMRDVMEERRANAVPLSDAELARYQDWELALKHNGGELTKAQLDAEFQRRKDQKLRDKWAGRSPAIDQLTGGDMGELETLGMMTEAQSRRELARRKRRQVEGSVRWSLQGMVPPPPRTRDEELMLMDHMDLMGLKSRISRAAVFEQATTAEDWTLAEVDAEFASRRVVPREPEAA